MMNLKIKDKEYKVKFGYNSFCDTDLLDKTAEVMGFLHGEGLQANPDNPNNMDFVRKMFTVTRDLLFEGFKRFNPVEDKNDIGLLLDEYYEENPTEHGLLNVFVMIAQELLSEGFFGNLLTKANEEMEALKKKVSKKNQKNT